MAAADIATLGIKIDSSQAGSAKEKLDELAASGARAEDNVIQLSRAAQALNAVHANVAVNTARAGATMKLTATDALNLSRQMADVGVTAAMGMSPFMILVQQGPQIYDVFQQSGLGAKQFGLELLQMSKVIRIVEVANDNMAVKTAALAAAQVEVEAATVALSKANSLYGFSMDRNSERLAIQTAETRLAAAEAAKLEAAQAGVTTSSVASFTGMAKGAGIAAAAIVAVAGSFAMIASGINEQNPNILRNLNLTEKQLERVKKSGVDTSVTMTDTFFAMGGAIGDSLLKAFDGPLDTIEEWWKSTFGTLDSVAFDTAKHLVGSITGAVAAIKVAIKEDLAGAVEWTLKNEVNTFIDDLESLSKRVVGRINQAQDAMGFSKQGRLTPGMVDFGGMKLENNAPVGKSVQDAYEKGYQEGVNGFVDRSVSRVEGRINDAAGKRDNDAERQRERDIKASEAFIESLKSETAEIGKNRMESKQLAIDKAVAIAPTKALKDEIIALGAAWKEATVAQAIKDFKKELREQNEELKFETSLLGMNAKEREVAIAMRQLENQVAALAKEGIIVSAKEIEAETAAIRANAEARGQRKLDVDNAKAYTDQVKEMNAVIRDSVSGFGDMFGNVGKGFEDLVTVLTNYSDKYAEIQQRIAEADERTIEGQRERERASREMAQLEMKHYGDILGSSKNFFEQGSKGYRVLEAAERAYRIYQTISTLASIANSGKEIAMDTTKTLTSVANSGARATADGVAGIAKSIASLTFPFNIVAGAATAAALIGFGVKLFGGGGGGGAASASASANSTGYDDSTAYRSPYSTSAGQDGLYDPRNAGGAGSGPNANPTVQAGGGGGFTYAPTIDARGADPAAIERLNEVMAENRQAAVNEARQLAAQDRVYANSRQRIG